MQHVVTSPRAPFTSVDRTFEVHQIPAWTDNLIWLLVCAKTREAPVVDGPEASGVLAYCDVHGFKLTTILNTHTHPDHIGINKDLQRRGMLDGVRVYGPAAAMREVPGLTDPVTEGDTAEFGAVRGAVWLTEGHLNGHITFIFDDVVFCGDTLFGAGCGYLFDGPPAAMHDSLQRLASLPGSTRVCCAHEYTEDNLLFAWTIEPENTALHQRIHTVLALRRRGESSVPFTIAEETATNPFIRVQSEAVQRAAGHPRAESAEVFAAIRALKDTKQYRASEAEWTQRFGAVR